MIKAFNLRIAPVFLFFILLPGNGLAETGLVPDTGRWISQTGMAGWITAAAVLLLVCSIAVLLLQGHKVKNLKAQIKAHQKVSYQALQRQQSMNDILNHLNDFVFFHDLSGNFYEFNTAVGRASDYTEAELMQMSIKDLVPEPYTAQVDDYLQRIRKNGEDRGYMRLVNKKGEPLILEYNSSLIYDDTGAHAGVRGIARDITEQHLTRQELKKSEKKYRTILDTIEDGYYEVDLAGNYQLLNRSTLRMLGYTWEELDGQNYKKLISPKDAQTVFETFHYVYRTGNPVKSFNWRVVCKDGSICHTETSVSMRFDEHGKAVGFQGILRDISERIQARKKTKQLEGQLQQAQKMESIGTLAGGIAHDFNNILFPIIGYAELAMQDLPVESPTCQNLEKVLKAADRAKRLVHQILTFSRQSADQDPEPVYVQPVIKETLKLLRNTIPTSIEIRSEIKQETGLALIHPARLHQVLMNLCTNAYHAMEDCKNGVLEVRLEQIEITAENTETHPHLAPGAYVCITVSDTGCGIDPEIMEKIFDPYFTTKAQEKGTGLGLAVSYGIVKNAGGLIAAESVPENGSRFHVYLPMIPAGVQQRPLTKSDAPLPRGREQILLIDDEKRVLEIEKLTLESLGYRVVPTTSSTKALNAIKTRPDEFDLVITDQSMPQMNGLELILEIRKIRSHIPVILCTGFTDKVNRESIRDFGIQALLFKPIAKRDFAETVRKTLDSREPISLKEKKS